VPAAHQALDLPANCHREATGYEFLVREGHFFYRDGGVGRNGLFLARQVIYFKIRGRTESRGCVLQISREEKTIGREAPLFAPSS